MDHIKFTGFTGVSEYRQDLYDMELYTKKQFIDHYGGDIEWSIMDPKKVLKRKMIEEMMFRYSTLGVRNINHLLDKMIETFM